MIPQPVIPQYGQPFQLIAPGPHAPSNASIGELLIRMSQAGTKPAPTNSVSKIDNYAISTPYRTPFDDQWFYLNSVSGGPELGASDPSETPARDAATRLQSRYLRDHRRNGSKADDLQNQYIGQVNPNADMGLVFLSAAGAGWLGKKVQREVMKRLPKMEWRGDELRVGKDLRIAPYGNRTGHPIGRFPHYHRRGKIDPRTGRTRDGQGIGRHRPWETNQNDRSFWDRF